MTRLLSVVCVWMATCQLASGAGLPIVDPALLGMRAKHLEHIEREAADEQAKGEFAGCVVAVGRRAGLAMLWAHGERQVEPDRQAMTVDTVFDLASLTKPIATATSIMILLEEGRLRLRDPISRHLPEITNEHADRITIDRLLTHHTGYIPDNPLEDYRHGVDEAWSRLFALTPQDAPGTRFRYSDVNFELLGRLVERIGGQTLDDFARQRIFEPLGMKETGYLPPADLRARSAASEPRDAKMLVGEVHDPRAALLGGVAGHAGLFSTATDLACYATMMLREGEFHGSRILAPATVREMTRPRDVSGSRRGAGWDMRSGYSSNRGELMSDRAFGHGGFTGTAIWIDPGLDLFVIFLSNRLHPDGRGGVNDLAGRIATIAAASIEQP